MCFAHQGFDRPANVEANFDQRLCREGRAQATKLRQTPGQISIRRWC
jgi:hypothetical protein